jgi:hypothetical protein
MFQTLLSKKFNQNLILFVLISAVLSNFSFTFYVNYLNPALKTDSVAKIEAIQNWVNGVNIFNIFLIFLMVWVGIVYIFTSFKTIKADK